MQIVSHPSLRPEPSFPHAIGRRDWLRSAVAALAAPACLQAGTSRRSASKTLRVVETAGLRRFGYPVHTALPILARPDDRFRLLRDARPVPAQFRIPEGPSDRPPALSLDFNSSPAPFESETYTVEYGPDVEPGPEPRRGLTVEHADGRFRIANGPALRFDLPDNLRGFLQAVGNPNREYLEPGSPGLWVQDRDGKTHPVGPAVGAIRWRGPLAVAIRYALPITLGDGPPLNSWVEMSVPSTKSWVETTWTLPDTDQIPAVGLDLDLKLEGTPTLVDLGADSTVYGTLKGHDLMRLEAGPAPDWKVLKGMPEKLEAFAASLPDARKPAEGWVHVMDRDRCTALAVSEFGREGVDTIEATADGRVRLRRTLSHEARSGPARPRTWRFWFHFVPMPVQVGAATSPQAMLAPLRVELL